MSNPSKLPTFDVNNSKDISNLVESNNEIKKNVDESLKKYPSNIKASLEDLTGFVESLKMVYSLSQGTNANVELIQIIGNLQTLINDYNLGYFAFNSKCIDIIQNLQVAVEFSKENTKESSSIASKSSSDIKGLIDQCNKFIKYSDNINSMVETVNKELTNQLNNKDKLNSNTQDLLKDCNTQVLKDNLLNSQSIMESNKKLKLFWEKVIQQCNALTDTGNIKGLSEKVEGEKGLTNFENSIKLVGYDWISLSHIVQTLEKPLKELKSNIDNLMSNLPNSSQSLANIKSVCETTGSQTTKSTTKPSQ